MKTVVDWLNKNNEWLYIKIYDNPFFFFDFWTFVHIWCGGIIITLLIWANWKHKWKILFAILLMYEIIEIIIIYTSLNIFKPETIKDQFTDIIAGMAGGFILYKWMQYYKSKKDYSTSFFKNPSTHISLFTAVTITFLWVGYYGYKYNVVVLNSPGLNYYAFTIWFFGIFLIITLSNILFKKFNILKSIATLWVLYFVFLCTFEFSAYHIFGLKEIGNHGHKPMILDIIHGSTSLHVFYLILPFISLGLNSLFKRLFDVARVNV